MAKKNDTPILIAAFLITAALISFGGWWLTRQFGDNLGGIVSDGDSSSSATSSSPASSTVADIPSSQNFASVASVVVFGTRQRPPLSIVAFGEQRNFSNFKKQQRRNFADSEKQRRNFSNSKKKQRRNFTDSKKQQQHEHDFDRRFVCARR